MIHKILFGFIIMISGFAFGQTINFPDVNFKNALLPEFT